MNPTESATRLVQRMMASDRPGATRMIENMLGDGIATQRVLTEVLDPAMVNIGRLWSQEEVSLSQAFVAAKIAEDILFRCLPADKSSARAPKGIAVLGNIEDDFHSLGRRIVASFLSASGWEVHDLGNDVPAPIFIEKALEVKADVIGASAMMQTTALNIRKLRDLLDRRGLHETMQLAVGGAVFNCCPELAEEVGADGTATNAAKAAVLFETLQRKTAP